jgi:hypothetical protein
MKEKQKKKNADYFDKKNFVKNKKKIYSAVL